MTDHNGRIGRRVRAQAVRVPAGLRLGRERLVWDSLAQHTWARCDYVLLNAFVRIARAKDRSKAIARFGRRFGVLGAAKLKPDWPAREPGEIEFDGDRWVLGHDAPNLSWEPVGIWDAILDSIVAALNIGAEIHQGRPGSAADWAALGWSDVGVPSKDVSECAGWLSRELSSWLEIGRVRISLDHDAAGWRTELAFGGRWNLFGALALQATLAVAGIDLYCCTGCKLPYIRSREERRPKPNQNNYCNDCRKSGQPLRDAKARYRGKVQHAKKTNR